MEGALELFQAAAVKAAHLRECKLMAYYEIGNFILLNYYEIGNFILLNYYEIGNCILLSF